MKKRPLWIWNQAENRLRAGWRVLLQMLLTSGLLLAAATSGFFNGGKFQLVRIEITLMVIGVSVLLFMTLVVDKRNFRDLGVNVLRKGWWPDLGFGVFLGLFQTIAFLLAASLLGWITIEPFFLPNIRNVPLITAFLMDMLAFICVAIMEELIRAYQLRNVAEGVTNSTSKWRVGLLVGALVASLFSVGMHLNQHGPGFWSYVFLSSMLYCTCFVFTGRVAIAMGLHFAWDFFTTTLVSLGGAEGINAAVLFSAPLTLEGNMAYLKSHLDLLGLAVQIPLLALILGWVRLRSGKLQLHKEITNYFSRGLFIEKGEDISVEKRVMKDA